MSKWRRGLEHENVNGNQKRAQVEPPGARRRGHARRGHPAGFWEEMERDPSVFLIGEDVGAYGGAFKVTDGLID